MPKAETNDFRTEEEYRIAAETFARLTGYFLIQMAHHPLDVKNTILQNFMARTVTMVRGIRSLWGVGDFQDCWILHRCLMDRYFLLASLGRNGDYQAFDDWSFMRQFEALNRVRSDSMNKDLLDSPLFSSTREQRERYNALSKSPPKWKRPRAEDVAKEAGVPFLYHYGYDFASMHVHPMANDGHEDFYAITKLEPKPDFPPHISVLHNSLLIGCLLVTDCLHQSDFRWMAAVADFYDHLMKFLEAGSVDYMQTFLKFAHLEPSTRLCEPTEAPSK